MKCMNPECLFDSPYLRDGSLHLLELESSSGRRIESNERGFPMRSSPQRFFWLCVECTKQFTIVKWTSSGVVLALRKLGTLTSDMDAPADCGLATDRSQSRSRVLPSRTMEFATTARRLRPPISELPIDSAGSRAPRITQPAFQLRGLDCEPNYTGCGHAAPDDAHAAG